MSLAVWFCILIQQRPTNGARLTRGTRGGFLKDPIGVGFILIEDDWDKVTDRLIASGADMISILHIRTGHQSRFPGDGFPDSRESQTAWECELAVDQCCLLRGSGRCRQFGGDG